MQARVVLMKRFYTQRFASGNESFFFNFCLRISSTVMFALSIGSTIIQSIYPCICFSVIFALVHRSVYISMYVFQRYIRGDHIFCLRAFHRESFQVTNLSSLLRFVALILEDDVGGGMMKGVL